MNLFRDQIYKYIKHSHSARGKDLQFKKSRDVFGKGAILSIVNFAENYTFTLQKEIQSEYCHSDKVSILVHIMYRHAELDVDGFDSNENNREVIKEYHFYISDDRTHDTCFVQHCFGMLYKELSRRKITFKEHWVWLDGCAGQFKSACSFLWLSCLHRNTDVHHTWRFFEMGHGKGEQNGAGACMKCALRRYQMNHFASRLVNSSSGTFKSI